MQLILGDCIEVLKDIPDKSIDLILCDPPYGSTASTWDVCLDMSLVFPHLWRVLKSDCACLLFGSEPFSTMIRTGEMQSYCYDWYWNKKFAGNFVQAKRMPLKTIEIISVFSENGKLPRYFPQVTTRDRPIKKGANGKTEGIPIAQTEHARAQDNKQYDTKQPTTLLEYSVREERGHHPTQKPVSLLMYLISTYTREGDTVLDFCMGSGSTGVACAKIGRDFIGIEKEQKYYDIAKERTACNDDIC